MSKHDLRARPVFHHQRDAIEAHLTVVMTALAVARHLQETTGISIKRILRTLKPLPRRSPSILTGHQPHRHPASDRCRQGHPHRPERPTPGTLSVMSQVRRYLIVPVTNDMVTVDQNEDINHYTPLYDEIVAAGSCCGKSLARSRSPPRSFPGVVTERHAGGLRR